MEQPENKTTYLVPCLSITLDVNGLKSQIKKDWMAKVYLENKTQL